MSIYGLLANAVKDPDGRKGAAQGYDFLFSSGDLCQMAEIGRFLRDRGFDVGHRNVYPAVKTEDEFKRGSKLIWDERVDGWWNYSYQFVKYSICTQEEFEARLKRL